MDATTSPYRDVVIVTLSAAVAGVAAAVGAAVGGRVAAAVGGADVVTTTGAAVATGLPVDGMVESGVIAPDGRGGDAAVGVDEVELGNAEAVSIGDYKHPRTPEEPIVIDLHKSPCAPGKTRKEQIRLGQRELLTTTFETFERNIRDQLGRTLSGGGFDPGRDIEAITVNRWPHGYAYNYNTLADPVDWSLSTPDDRACVVGRKQFGRISIANSDAAGSSHTDAAFEQAFRAVGEVIESGTSSYLSRIEKS